jgi:hypothetical protein
MITRRTGFGKSRAAPQLFNTMVCHRASRIRAYRYPTAEDLQGIGISGLMEPLPLPGRVSGKRPPLAPIHPRLLLTRSGQCG